jgi:predicted nucleic acid-binding protein
MVYVDTSVLVAYYCPERLSEKAEKLLMSFVRPAISSLTEVEFFSAISGKVRKKEINLKDAGRLTARLLAHIDADHYSYILIEGHHYRLARDWIGMFKMDLRTLDAIHLAVASSEGLSLLTSDQRLFKSAKALAQDAILLE